MGGARTGRPKTDESVQLSSLQRVDAAIRKIVVRVSHVVLYTFHNEEKKWEKANVEGTLFVVRRDSKPKQAIVIQNRVSPDDFVIDVTGKFSYEVRGRYVMYRVEGGKIKGIWFAKENERDEFLEVLKQFAGKPRESPLSSAQGAAQSTSSHQTGTALQDDHGRAAGATILAMIQQGQSLPGNEAKSSERPNISQHSQSMPVPIPLSAPDRTDGASLSTSLGSALHFGAESRSVHTPSKSDASRPPVRLASSWETPPLGPQGGAPPTPLMLFGSPAVTNASQPRTTLNKEEFREVLLSLLDEEDFVSLLHDRYLHRVKR